MRSLQLSVQQQQQQQPKQRNSKARYSCRCTKADWLFSIQVVAACAFDDSLVHSTDVCIVEETPLVLIGVITDSQVLLTESGCLGTRNDRAWSPVGDICNTKSSSIRAEASRTVEGGHLRYVQLMDKAAQDGNMALFNSDSTVFEGEQLGNAAETSLRTGGSRGDMWSHGLI